MRKILRFFPLSILFLLFLGPQNLMAQGHFEFGFHYSQWSIDLFRGLIEDSVSETLESELKEDILDEIRSTPGNENIQETYYSQEVKFDSGGWNYGFEVRWYPAGKYGSYSLGFSLEKTHMRVSFPEASAHITLEDQSKGETGDFQGEISDARFEIWPLSMNLSFRWDIKPSWRWRPYITFGVGLAGAGSVDKGEYSIAWSGTAVIDGDVENHSDSRSGTIAELREELEEEDEDFFIPEFFPFIQLNLGVKGEVYDNLYVLIDVGVWDGLLFRLGVAYRL